MPSLWEVVGRHANEAFPADFLSDNLAIGINVLRAAVATKVKKLMFLGSSCVFPRNAPQPMTEDLLLTGALEPTNEWYAVAKIAGLKLAQAYRRQFGVDFISVMPTNLYGPGDNYHPANSHGKTRGGLIPNSSLVLTHARALCLCWRRRIR